jgi:hypothetical protein
MPHAPSPLPDGLGHESPSIRDNTMAVNLKSIEHHTSPLIPNATRFAGTRPLGVG